MSGARNELVDWQLQGWLTWKFAAPAGRSAAESRSTGGSPLSRGSQLGGDLQHRATGG